MSETLNQMCEAIEILPESRASEFRDELPRWLDRMNPIRYSCLGCEHCYAGVAEDAFIAAFPEVESQFGMRCEIQSSSTDWPLVVGENIFLDPSAPVAVTTLGIVGFTKQLANQYIPGMAIVGKLEIENIGTDKIIKNTIANPNLRFLILVRVEPEGHLCGQTLLAL